MRRRLLAAITALAPCAVGCGSPPPPTPSAVVLASPTSVCEGDAFATPITLDATQSQRHLTLVPVPPAAGEAPLQLDWSFAGSAYRLLDGDFHSKKLTVSMLGDRPLHAWLVVHNDEGGEARADLTVSITLRDAEGNCPLPPVDGGAP